MSAQPEALRLAEFLEMHWCNVDMPEAKAAAELRRLHEAHDWQYRMAGERLRRIEKLEAQRDALLGLLKEARKIIRASSSRNFVKDWDQRTTDAIKAVEEEA